MESRMKKFLVALSLLMTFVSAITIPDFLPRKASHASLCQAERGPENVQRFASDFELALRIALWFIIAQTMVVLALAYVTRTRRESSGETSGDAGATQG
jgi:hypothetical protein